MKEPQTSEELERQLADLRQGDHLCMVYESQAEQMAAVVPFIRDGLARGECCVYIADEQTVEEVAAALAAAGVDVAREIDRGAVALLTKRDSYLRSGEFDPQGMIEFLRECVEQAVSAGFAGFRVTGEMTWALGTEAGCDRLIEYEALLNDFFPGSRALAICQYNRSRFPPAVVHDVLRTHPQAILGNQVCQNLYYEPPDLVLQEGQEARRVEWMVGRLKQAREAEQRLQVLNDTLEQRVAERTALAEEQSRRLRALALELTRTEQRERKRLAQSLHDHLQQLLVAARMGVSRLKRSNHTPDDDLPRKLEAVDDLLARTIESSRALTVELSPPVLHDAGLIVGLEWLARWMRSQRGLTVELRADPAAEPLEEDVRLFLFEAVRELLLNVARHAEIDRADVELTPAAPGQVRIVVSDAGAGFNANKLQAGRTPDDGFGLFSLSQRVDCLGGTLDISSAPGQGARITLLVPIGPLKHLEQAIPTPAAQPVLPDKPPVWPSDFSTGSGRIRVLLADDHGIVRQGISMLLRDQPDIEVVGEASDGRTTLELARTLQPDVVVMDVNMPRLNGIQATRRIAAELPDVRVIGLSFHQEEDMARTLRDAGAVAYLTKGGPSEELIAAIRDCVAPAA